MHQSYEFSICNSFVALAATGIKKAILEKKQYHA
jgi:hypothetical protein